MTAFHLSRQTAQQTSLVGLCMSRLVSHDEALALFLYDPETGVFRWRVGRRAVSAGDIAGSPALGRRGGLTWRIRVRGVRYAAHRLAFFYVNGRWPTCEIDHINGDAMDNRIVNLREVSREQNEQNKRRARKDSTSGLIGAMRNPRGGWKSTIRTNGKRLYLGSFTTPQAAHEAYVAAKRRLHSTCSI